MNVVDSSAWLEYLTAGPNAKHFEGPLSDSANLVVPSISIYEVFKAVLVRRGENDALRVVAQMLAGRVVELDASLALAAARVSAEHGIPMADSIVLATAHAHDAVLWTQDSHFARVPGVRFFVKKRH
jgi:predicted nucleic acid-binding protein